MFLHQLFLRHTIEAAYLPENNDSPKRWTLRQNPWTKWRPF